MSTAELHQIIGAFDGYGACRWKVICKEPNGELSQLYPGHSDAFIGLHHKKWRWWVKEARLDGPELMHWTPDVEEMDVIQRIVDELQPPRPEQARYVLDGCYPNWRQVNRAP